VGDKYRSDSQEVLVPKLCYKCQVYMAEYVQMYTPRGAVVFMCFMCSGVEEDADTTPVYPCEILA